VRCESSGVLVPKDKAIKRFIVRNIVDASAIRDIQDASVLEGQCIQLIDTVLFSCQHEADINSTQSDIYSVLNFGTLCQVV